MTELGVCHFMEIIFVISDIKYPMLQERQIISDSSEWFMEYFVSFQNFLESNAFWRYLELIFVRAPFEVFGVEVENHF